MNRDEVMITTILLYGLVETSYYGTLVFRRPSDNARFSSSPKMILNMINGWMWNEVQSAS